MAPRSFLTPLLAAEGGRFTIRLSQSGRVVADEIEDAFDSESRRRGLLGRHRFDAGSAIILAPCNAIHTFFMRFPIDVLFADRNGLILKARASVRPWRIAIAVRAYAVIELPAGTLERARVTPGMSIEIVPV